MIQGMSLTMSSREIAELTGKRHDHVMRDIKAMLDGLWIDAPNFGAVYQDAKGEKRRCFNLPKRETLILVSGYSVQMRAKIIDRWQELEAQVAAPAVPKTLSEALRLVHESVDVGRFRCCLTYRNRHLAMPLPSLVCVAK